MSTVFARQALLESGWAENVELTIGADGRIGQIKTGCGSNGGGHDLLLPAPANLHSHTFQRAMAGLTERRGRQTKDSFWSWRRLMYRFLDQLTPGQIEAIAAQAFMEMLESGFGSAAEFHYIHNLPDGTPYGQRAEICGRIVKAAEISGIGLTLLPVLYVHGGCDRRPLEGGQRRFFNNAGSFAELHSGARKFISSSHADFAAGAAAHSLRAVDPDNLSECFAIAAGGPFHIHAAEQTAEIEEISRHLGSRPIEFLLAEQSPDASWCVIHATHMTKHETIGLADSGAVAGLCPVTEANLGDGIFNGSEYFENGGRFGVGTDSNVNISLFGELRMLEYSQRLARQARCVLAEPGGSTGRSLFECAAIGGAAAAGRPCGSISTGKFADLTAVSADNDRICGRLGDDALDSLIFAGDAESCITDVWSAGRHVVQGGRHTGRDRISENFLRVMRELRQEL